jgi:hypothetical protein
MTTRKQFSITPTVFLLFLVMSAFELMSQTNSVPVINQKQEHILKSKINGTTYHLYVSLPQHYSTKDTTHYPVLYLLDGGFSFPIAHSARNALDIFGELKHLIIVGIEYDWEQSLTPWTTNRWKDYTPTKDANYDSIFIKWYGLSFGLPEGSLLSGGGPVFLNVIRKEIIPFIDKEYKTTTDRGISGQSFGGLFAAYCLFSAPDLFNKFGINSPSFWWDKKEMFKMEKTFSEHNQSLGVQVFMSAGSLEGESMTPVMTAFADSLRGRKYKGLKLTTYIFEGETHMSVMPAMISRTLRVLYGVKKE